MFKLGGGQIMPGFDEGLRGAKEGSRRSIRMPPELAFGENGKGTAIPPNADLEFDVEVTKISRGFKGELELFGEARAFGLVGKFF